MSTRKICSFASKEMHRTRAKAVRHLRGLERSQGYVGSVYQCGRCKAWHVGRFASKPPTEPKRERGRTAWTPERACP